MKFVTEKGEFTKSWSIAERNITTSMSALSGVLVKAKEDGTLEMRATDLKTGVTVSSSAAQINAVGEAILPVKSVGELFRKISGDTFTLSVDENKAVLSSGKSKYRFATYPVEEFPKIPSSQSADILGSVAAQDLLNLLSEGSLGATLDDVYPQYYSTVRIEREEGQLKAISTDTRIMAYSSIDFKSSDDREVFFMLPLKGVKELERILSTVPLDEDIKIMYDDAQVYFVTKNIEFSIRKLDVMFPQYKRVMSQEYQTFFEANRADLAGALERINIVVRDFNKFVKLSLSPGGSCTMKASSPSFGDALEEIDGNIDGEPIKNRTFNIKLLIDVIKTIKDKSIKMELSKTSGFMVIKRTDSERFLCLIAPIDNKTEEEDEEKEVQEEKE